MDANTKFCPSCGESGDLQARFCERCGHAFSIKVQDETRADQHDADPVEAQLDRAAGERPTREAQQSGVRDILERKTSEELLDYWKRRSDCPVETIRAVQAILVARGVTATSELAPPTQFKNTLSASCTDCGYKGIMGWNKRRVSSGMAALMVASIPIGMILSGVLFGVVPIGGFLIFVPAILLRFAFQRYYAQCRQCKAWLMLKTTQVSDVRKVQAA